MDRRLAIGVCLATMMISACGSSPTGPSAVTACERNNTADVKFGNRSRTTTQDIVWDGATVATVAPGQDSVPRTVAAGIAHRLEVRITNTTQLACQISTPIPDRCGAPVYTCAFP